VSDYFQLDLRFDVEKAGLPLAALEKRDGTMQGNDLRMFLPITKVDAVNRLVYGLATAEVPDRAGEICDYDGTKPYYEKWSADIAKASDGKSLGNVRAMHGKSAAGVLKELHFNDSLKQIEVCAKIVDDQDWLKVQEGVYTGFSQGGGYVKRWTDSANPRLTRYIADPIELSLVDIPCLPTATFQLIKSVGPVPEVEIRSFVTVDNEQGVQEAFQKLHSGQLDAELSKEAAADDLNKAGGEDDKDKKLPPFMQEKDKEEDAKDKGADEDKEKAEKTLAESGLSKEQIEAFWTLPTNVQASVLEEIKKAMHQPGREESATAEAAAIARTSGHVPDLPSMTGSSGTGNGEPNWRRDATAVDPGATNKEHESGAHEHEPKTREGNPDNSAGGVNSDQGSGSPGGGQPGVSKSADGTGGTETPPADLNPGLRQYWLAKDNKPFAKKADAVAWNQELDRQQMMKELTAPADAAMASLREALDSVDGGTVKISDAQAFDKAWQAAVAGQQTRSGMIPLGKVYNSVDELPAAVKEHFTSANKQRQWMHVWNSVYKESGDEQKAFAQAWSAAEKALNDEQLEKQLKPHGNVPYADPGLLKGGKSLYPLDTSAHVQASWTFMQMPRNIGKYTQLQLMQVRKAISEAWLEKVSKEGPPDASTMKGIELLETMGSCISKHLYDVGEVACSILRLYDIKECLALEAIREGDNSPMAAELERNISNLCMFLRRLVEEETSELVMGTEDMGDYGDQGTALVVLTRAAVGPNASYLHGLLDKAVGKAEEEAEEEAKKKGFQYKKSPAVRLIDALEKVGRRLGQVNRMHLQAAHDHVSAMTDGDVCMDADVDKWVSKAGAALSTSTRSSLKKIHDGMADLGADCAMSKGVLLRSTDEEIGSFEKSMGFGEGALSKMAEENIVLKRVMGNLTGQVQELVNRVKDLEKMPEPARGVKRIMPGVVAVEKGGDTTISYSGRGSVPSAGNVDTPEMVKRYLDGLDPQTRALELIKAAQRNPVLVTRN
jgi:hypothetical protein